ncbi:MAG: FliG C-terminal domain-containing protein [Spirochaetales bacterium]|nr:FliG C-terminal domain-containing protein [Spirochaetales bacterium]
MSNKNFQVAAYLKNQKSDSETDARLKATTDYLKTGGLLKVPVEPQNSDGKDSVYRKVAKFLLIIGEDEAAKILQHLPENQIEKIIPEIASIRTVSDEEATVILEEFNERANRAKSQGGAQTAREILTKAYGKERAEQLLSKSIPAQTETPFEYLFDLDKERIYQLLSDENIGIQSLVISKLPPKKAASVINMMKENEKKELVVRLAKMEAISPEVLRRVNQAMMEKEKNLTVENTDSIDGRNALAQILKRMDFASEKDILETLSVDDPDLGKDLRSRLFTDEDVINADDRFIQEVLHNMSEVEIAYLLCGKSQDFREKILFCISSGRRMEVREQEEILKPMRKSECDRITNEFLAKLRTGFETGQLIIKDRNDDDFVE